MVQVALWIFKLIVLKACADFKKITQLSCVFFFEIPKEK